MPKGPQFERDICRSLSLWWTGNRRDDVFWRTHGSGARATARHKVGKRTRGQYGDICATDPIGTKLVDLFTFSLKRGYSKHTLQDLVDAAEGVVNHWENWIREAIDVHLQAGSLSWIIIAKRDRREPIIVVPHEIMRAYLGGIPIMTVWYDDLPKLAVHKLEYLLAAKPADLKSIK